MKVQKGQVYISNPYIVENKETIRLCSNISGLSETDEQIWFEFPIWMREYINENDSTPFLVALLPNCCAINKDIYIEGCVSEKLVNNILFKLIPLWEKNSSLFGKIEIHVKGTKQIYSYKKMHVGTGISCGVDSFDAIKSSMDFSQNYQVDTLTFFNVGSHKSTSGLSDKESRELFSKRSSNSCECAKKLNLKFLTVDSNLGSILKVKFVQVHQFCNFAAVLACGNYFSSYYYASGYSINDFNTKKVDHSTAYYETYLCQLLSTERTTFSILGENRNRIEKVENISSMDVAKKYLNVCYNEDYNCGICEKCIRTQMELFAIGKLDDFVEVFNIKVFYKNYFKNLEFVFRKSANIVFKEIIDKLRENPNIKVPLIIRTYGCIARIAHKILRRINRRRK